MSEPFIFIGTYTFKEGKVEDYKKGVQQFCEFIEANEPRMIAFNVYTNEEDTEVSIVQVHPDAESMLFHMSLISEHIEASGDVFDYDAPASTQVFGPPGGGVLEMIKRFSKPGFELKVKPNHLGGFTRSAADRAPAAS